MPLTTEVLIFESSEAFRNDPDVVIPAFEQVLKAHGVHAPGYYGKQIEEPSTYGYIFLSWDDYGAHKALIDGPSYATVLGALKPSLGGKVEMYHVQFSDPPIAFEDPVTEVVILTLKAPDSEHRASVVDVLSKFSEESEKKVVFGQTREDENKYVVISGWPTVEAHLEVAAKPEAAATMGKLFSLANRDHFYHTKLSKYPL